MDLNGKFMFSICSLWFDLSRRIMCTANKNTQTTIKPRWFYRMHFHLMMLMQYQLRDIYMMHLHIAANTIKLVSKWEGYYNAIIMCVCLWVPTLVNVDWICVSLYHYISSSATIYTFSTHFLCWCNWLFDGTNHIILLPMRIFYAFARQQMTRLPFVAKCTVFNTTHYINILLVRCEIETKPSANRLNASWTQWI